MNTCNFCEESKYISSLGVDSLRYHASWSYCPEHRTDAQACRDAVLVKKIGKTYEEVSTKPFEQYLEWLK
jgi:hypothetical protein